MTALHDFNQQRYEDALAHILPCVAIPAWAEALVRGVHTPAGMHCSSAASALAQQWDEIALTLALSAHPRIGEKPAGTQAEAALSRQEQGPLTKATRRSPGHCGKAMPATARFGACF
jgi:2-oxo-4-hydroxy-4-carboxy-5-ureidoimidazoline decarboxylase